MYPIPEGLKPSDVNKLDSYFPLRNKGNEFDWSTITGLVLAYILKKQIKSYSIDEFRAECKIRFDNLLEDPNYWAVIEDMYFSTDGVLKISPVFLLFRAQFKGKGKIELGAPNWRMGTLFAGLLGEHKAGDGLHDDLNFLEHELVKIFVQRLDQLEKDTFPTEISYLPYLASAFREDIDFLCSKPSFLMEHLEDTLRLYSFSYCAQLALNMRAWREGQPVSRKIYFLLDNEKASAERAMVQNYGYKMFSKASEYLFPILSSLEVLQIEGPKRPLWKVYAECCEHPSSSHILEELNTYICAFRDLRELPAAQPATKIEDAFQQLETVAMDQFRALQSHRSGVNKKYMLELEGQLGAEFIVNRGRAGKVLVLNQDQLVLLTNLSIGSQEKLRLHELVGQFERRGFYLDNQSQQVLVSFFERMGNIERMSDSGDAVYVRKTI